MSASPGVLRLLARPLSQLSPARPACRLLAVSSGPALNQLVPQIRSTRLLHSARSHCQQSDQAPPVKRSKNVDKDVTSEELSHFDKLVAEDKEKQIRTPCTSPDGLAQCALDILITKVQGIGRVQSGLLFRGPGAQEPW